MVGISEVLPLTVILFLKVRLLLSYCALRLVLLSTVVLSFAHNLLHVEATIYAGDKTVFIAFGCKKEIVSDVFQKFQKQILR